MPENGTTLPRAMQRLDCRPLLETTHLRIHHRAATPSPKRNSNERTVRNRSSFLSPGDYRTLPCAFQISRDGLAELARACRSLSTDETIPSGNRPASATKAVVQELISIEAFPGISREISLTGRSVLSSRKVMSRLRPMARLLAVRCSVYWVAESAPAIPCCWIHRPLPMMRWGTEPRVGRS